jgi:Ribose/xylose/arabinose/galactoside ABC-type transport systems, permease components
MKTREGIYRLVLKNIPVLLFVIVFIIFGIFSPKFLSLASFSNIILNSSYVGIIAIGIMFVLLTAGIDLSVGSVMYLASASAGLLISEFHMPTGIGILGGIIVALAVGTVNAFCIIRLDILPFVTTLGTMTAGRAVGTWMTHSESVNLPKAVTSLGSQKLAGIPMAIILFLVIAVSAAVFLEKTQSGRQVYAVGNDPEEARKAGINNKKILFIVYILCALFAGIGGIISVAQIGIVNAAFGKGEEFNAIAAAVLGGTSLAGGSGKVAGTVLGAVMIQMIQSGLVYMQVDMYIQPLISAGIIFAAVFLDSIRGHYVKKAEARNIRNENLASE